MTRNLTRAAAISLMVLTFAPASGVTADSARGPAVTADEHFVFDVLRKGEPIGTHEVMVDRSGDTTRAVIDTRLRVRFLGFTVYRLDYSAEEVWAGDRLERLTVSVDRDGERLALVGRRVDGAFELTAEDGTRRLPLPLVPTNHWHPRILEQAVVLNTLTGHLNRVEVQAVGREALTLAGDNVPATRYRYDGELRLDSWYDDSGRWLAMSFEAEDGSVIEYRCRNCAAGDG